ncbi:MAG: prepilin-type N-terminal cleavage/methylation domain-containing protein [Candidatus Gracilibacteria bacterium]|nr:prepilin-type N-terminal cleavage/methylation domain-containing protein [Candidatus Gracilibacteria bacterium]
MKIKKINKKSNTNKIQAFTLVEIMLGILIVSLVLIGGFQSLSSVTLGKAKLIQKVDIQKESFYFTEKLFEMIKQGGTLDYEEYFNRKVIGNTTYSSGHFDILSGFGNFGYGGTISTNTNYGDSFYQCISLDGTKMPGTGCVDTYNSGSIDYTSTPQRYGQYSFQFIDYNSNFDDDLGDENNDGFIKGDDDDEYIGDGPEVFASGSTYPELYLISGNKTERTLFRWTLTKDDYAPSTSTCGVDSSTNTITGTGCIGTVEYLKLVGKDMGMNHDNTGNTYLDGVIDTWLVHPDFAGGSTNVIAGTDTDNYWVPLFSEYINVTEFKVYAYPNKDINLAWKNTDKSVNISPYTIIKIKLKPSWLTKRKIGGDGQEQDFSMTINLSDIYSK